MPQRSLANTTSQSQYVLRIIVLSQHGQQVDRQRVWGSMD